MKSMVQFVLVLIFSTISFGSLSQDHASIRTPDDLLRTCDKSDFRQYKQVEVSGKTFSLAASCTDTGEKGVFYLSQGSAYLVHAMEKNDPGIERFQELGSGSGILIYTNAVEPTGDEETHYVSLIDATRAPPVWMGSAWSFSEPHFFTENASSYVVVSLNSFGFDDPEAPGWPVVFRLSDVGMAQAPISEVPEYACEKGTEFENYLSAVSDYNKIRRELLSGGIGRLQEYCRLAQTRRTRLKSALEKN